MRRMHPHMPLIVTMAVALGLALVLGFAASRLKLPALVGYLLAGVLIGPHTPGFVADMDLASQLAEIGVMLLMFGVGLHFSFGDLLRVRKIAVPDRLVLVQAHIAEAGLLVVAAAESTDVRPMIETARTLNPGIPVIVRARNAEEADLLLKEGARRAIHGKGALAEVMVRDVLQLVEPQPGAAPAPTPRTGAV